MSTRRAAPVQPHHHSSPNKQGTSPFDPIITARRRFGAKVNLSGLGPGNERVVASQLLLIEAAGGAAVILDVTRSSIPFPHEQLFQYQQKEISSSSSNLMNNKQNSLESSSPSKREVILVEKEREATALDKAAWEVISSYRNLWIESWEHSDRIRSMEMKERKELYRVAAQSFHQSQKVARIQAVAWEMIGEVEDDIRERIEHEEELVYEGLLHFFRGRRNEIEISEVLNRRM